MNVNVNLKCFSMLPEGEAYNRVCRKALQQLLHSGTFIYNDITWRQVSRDAKTVVVRADIDGTTMCISLCHQLPWVLWMKNNPLGIDWVLTGMLPDRK